MGLDGTIYPINKDIAGGFQYCGKIDDTVIVEKTYLTTEDWPFFLLALALVGGVAIGLGMSQSKGAQGREDLNDIETVKSQVNDLARRPEVSQKVDSLQAELAQMQVTVQNFQNKVPVTTEPQIVHPEAVVKEEKKLRKQRRCLQALLCITFKQTKCFRWDVCLRNGNTVGSDPSRVELLIEIDTISGHHANIYFSKRSVLY